MYIPEAFFRVFVLCSWTVLFVNPSIEKRHKQGWESGLYTLYSDYPYGWIIFLSRIKGIISVKIRFQCQYRIKHYLKLIISLGFYIEIPVPFVIHPAAGRTYCRFWRKTAAKHKYNPVNLSPSSLPQFHLVEFGEVE